MDFNLREMLQLRGEGWSYSALGRKYNKDHTTILYHCLRLGVAKNQPPSLASIQEMERLKINEQGEIEEEEEEEEVVIPRVAPKYAYLVDEEVNRGKMYHEYLKEMLTRPIERRYYEIYYMPHDITFTPGHKEEAGSIINSLSVEMVPDEWPTELRD